MVELIRSRTPLADWPAEWFAVEDNVRRSDILLGNGTAPGDALRARGPAFSISAVSA